MFSDIMTLQPCDTRIFKPLKACFTWRDCECDFLAQLIDCVKLMQHHQHNLLVAVSKSQLQSHRVNRL